MRPMTNDWSNFFDPAAARGPRAEADVVAGAEGSHPAPAEADESHWSVSQLVSRVSRAVKDAFPETITVLGEISNFTRASSGHLYFSLKDENASIPCVMWRSTARRLKFDPADGLEVVASGKVDFYEVRSAVQLYAEKLTPRGEGALELAFRQLREKLAGEGLFDPDRRKPIPRFPRAVGVVTSPTGAAIRDIRRTLHRRWPGLAVFLVGVRVQGEQAAGEIAQAVRLLDAAAPQYGIDTIIVGRGGGSIEDLWAFNEEPVARAIAAARTPIIAGVGHEVDVTIADLVADRRAATPTAAAEVAVPDRGELVDHLALLSGRMRRCVRSVLDGARRDLLSIQRSGVLRDPLGRLRSARQHTDELAAALGGALRATLSQRARRLAPLADRLAALHPMRLLEQRRARLDRLADRLRWQLGATASRDAGRLWQLQQKLIAVSPAYAVQLARQRVLAAERQLEAMSYRSVLKRGFTVTRDRDGNILHAAGDAREAGQLETEFADGRVRSRAVDGDPPPPKPKPKPRKRRPKPPPPGPTLFDTPPDEAGQGTNHG
jgi:exodeoxyribonuclease VII large subunit